MTNNDVLRSLRYTLDLSDSKIVSIFKLSEHEVEQSHISNLLKKDDEIGYADCSDELMEFFLDGLIVYRRGKAETRTAQEEKPKQRLSNNTILKKLRVAFELKEDDMHKLLELSGFQVSKPELSAFFRKKGHKNYRECGDQILRNFLKGLTLHYRS
ncbi:MAG: DUF1456 family protein [Sulfuricellaceae bacterium]|nr:DUF1456 family protein [Sulfuricellaceae bacterium]